MDCPRCKLPLTEEKYEGIDVDLCPTCLGSWLDAGELEAVTDRKGYTWGKNEKDDILRAIAEANANGKAAPDEAIGCPKCAKAMEKVEYEKSGITIDRCAEHGVWLDSKEMKLVQVWAEHEAERAAKNQ